MVAHEAKSGCLSFLPTSERSSRNRREKPRELNMRFSLAMRFAGTITGKSHMSIQPSR